MSGTYPNLHPKLNNFNIFNSFEVLVGSEDKAISFLEEINLIPSRQSTPPQCCGFPMLTESSPRSKFGWVWRCSTKGSKKKGCKACRHVINPSSNTFFDGHSCHIDVNEVLAIVICFVIKMKVTDVYDNLQNWRLNKDGNKVSWNTVIDYFSYCREIAEVITSQSDLILGGKDKTVQIDETFLTKRKYNHGRLTRQMTITVLGLYCKEDKTGLFFRVNSKSKTELWSYIRKYIDYNTSRLCTDSAKQYHGVNRMFSSETVHLQTNHSKGEYVSKSDSANTINDLENQNKLLKKSIVSSRSDKLLHRYMALHLYRRNCLENKYSDKGSQIMQFLLDIKKVYPGVVDGELQEGLFLKEIDPPDQLTEAGLSKILSAKKPQLEEDVTNEINDIDLAIDEASSDQEYTSDDTSELY